MLYLFRKKICQTCKTGKLTYKFDPQSPVCPYLRCLDKQKCAFFVPMVKKVGFWEKLFCRGKGHV